ncbi:CASP-like protein 5B1 [Apium graveolens]|uniref:CASP-like protein 5B1 n=1 Tax=Apium graveolens TaxID=4045 RepID=UPI003D7A422B
MTEFGSPGKASGLLLRSGQFLFSSASAAAMVSVAGFNLCTAFCFLTGSMGLLAIWSFGLAYLDVQSLRLNRGLRTRKIVKLFAIGDWVTSFLALGSTTASAGVMFLFGVDTDLCNLDQNLGCIMFEISIALALISWFLLAISSHVMLWVLASFD